NVGFEDGRLQAVGSGRRLKGWQATPLSRPGTAEPLSVALRDGAAGPRGGQQHAVLGLGLGGNLREATIPPRSRALLTEEVRNPRAGKYIFTIHASGGGTSEAFFRDVFRKHFTCWLIIGGFLDGTKDPLKVREFASVPFRRRFTADGAKGYEKFSLHATL